MPSQPRQPTLQAIQATVVAIHLNLHGHCASTTHSNSIRVRVVAVVVVHLGIVAPDKVTVECQLFLQVFNLVFEGLQLDVI